jgi:hypothetical protein
MTPKFDNLASVLLEGVSKRRAKKNAEYVHDIVHILTRYLGFVLDRSKGSHVQYKRGEDGSTVGMINVKKSRRGNMYRGDEWKRILSKVFWWAPIEARDNLWTLARDTRGKDPSVHPPDRQV